MNRRRRPGDYNKQDKGTHRRRRRLGAGLGGEWRDYGKDLAIVDSKRRVFDNGKEGSFGFIPPFGRRRLVAVKTAQSQRFRWSHHGDGGGDDGDGEARDHHREVLV